MRQSQALVMTPQLMQAIKLLQLSSLDLAAYVDGELERNPLLERANEGEGAAADPAAAEPGPRRTAKRRPDEWFGQDLETSRTAIEERLDTDLENVFPTTAARPLRAEPPPSPPPTRNGPGSAPAGATASTISKPMSRRKPRSPTISPSSSPRHRGSGAPHDRPAPDRSRGRGRLFHRRPSRHCRQARRSARRGGGGAGASADASIRPASAPAT